MEDDRCIDLYCTKHPKMPAAAHDSMSQLFVLRWVIKTNVKALKNKIIEKGKKQRREEEEKVRRKMNIIRYKQLSERSR